MKITIHRGTHQIGGCVTEYANNRWRLFVDYGEELTGNITSKPLQIEGLTHGDVSKSALLITHYHGDHIGRIAQLPEELPIYMGKVGCEIQMMMSDHMKHVSRTHRKMAERLSHVCTFEAGKEFSFGPFTIMPVTIDHSAFDAYAFKIVADGVSIFHSGDFRTHGFRGKKLPEVIKKFVGKVNHAVCEGTNIRRPDATSLPEFELQRQFEAKFREHKGNIVYLSSSNIDRLFGLYHAALRAGRPFFLDAYQKRMMDVVTQKDSLWGKSKLYKFDDQFPPMVLQYEEDGEFRMNDKFRDFINDKGFVLIARANPRFDSFIERIPGEKQKYLSMWSGYVAEGGEAYNPALAYSLGDNYEYMHTSGHCDMQSMRELFRLLQPTTIIPIHTDHPEAFADLFCDEWPVTLLNDGESISPLPETVGVRSYVMYVKEPNQCCEKVLGYYSDFDDAKNVCLHTKYCTQNILGYKIEEEKGWWPTKLQIYDAEKKLFSSYTYGGHRPGEEKFQEPCRFAVGEKAMALMSYDESDNELVPVTVLGPVSREFFRKFYDMYYEQDPGIYTSFKKFEKDLNDWDWDSVVVQPLVKKDGLGDLEYVPRVHLFPYQEFTNEAK